MTEKGFVGVFDRVIRGAQLAKTCREYGPTARRPRKRSTEQVVGDLVFHQLHQDGTLAQHGAMLGGEAITDPAYTQRRELLPQELFTSILQAGLRPLASPAAHPDAFFAGWRLVGVDGSEVSVINTPANKRDLPKAQSRRGKAAFAKVKLVTAVELGLHNPLAAETGTLQDYEVDLALRLWPRLPQHSLAIIDRLYGVAKHLDQILHAGQGRDVEVLVRARGQVKAQRLRRLSDGSSLVQIRSARQPGQPAGEPITVREIRAVVRVPGKQSVRIRLWTTLLDAEAYPASVLVELYVQRWEHELTYRELKLDLRRGDVLDSHTPATALQELAAIVLAMATVAQVRATATEPLAQPARRISLRKLLLATLSLWEAFELAGPTLTPQQKAHALQRYFARLKREAILPKRRPRHCPRAVRQPVTGWPRLRRRSESVGAVSIRIVR